MLLPGCVVASINEAQGTTDYTLTFYGFIIILCGLGFAHAISDRG